MPYFLLQVKTVFEDWNLMLASGCMIQIHTTEEGTTSCEIRVNTGWIQKSVGSGEC